MLDLDWTRAQFPALVTPWALFDNAGGSVPARQVVDRVADYMSRLQVQHGASYAVSAEAVAALDAGRRAAARLVGASRDEVVLGASSTALARTLAGALVATWTPGDDIVVTDLDHEANVGPWRALEARGIEVREWRFRRDTQRLELEDLLPLLGPRTKLVAFTHVSNVVGTIHDVPAITAALRERGILSCVDGVAYAPHRRIDAPALGADFYLASLYKVYGPHVGLLYGRRDALLAGRNQNHFFVEEDQVPYKYEPGGVPHELGAGLAGITEYLDASAAHHGVDESGLDHLFAETEETLVAPLLDYLRGRSDVQLLGEPSADRACRVPTVAFTVNGVDSATIPVAVDEHQVAIRFGHFYAHRAVEALGLHPQNGVVRASLLHYNTPEEVERLIAALDAALP